MVWFIVRYMVDGVGGVAGVAGVYGLGGLGWRRFCSRWDKCPNKCPFCPLCVEVLKHEMQNIKKRDCDHNAHKTYFWLQKHVTDNFWGWRWGRRRAYI